MATPVWHGSPEASISPYNVVQHRYDPVVLKDGYINRDYVELLEIVDGSRGGRFVVHLYSYIEGSSYFVYTTLRFAKVAYERCLDKEFRWQELYLLEGCSYWERTGHNLPWFYSKADVDIAAML